MDFSTRLSDSSDYHEDSYGRLLLVGYFSRHNVMRYFSLSYPGHFFGISGHCCPWTRELAELRRGR